MKSYIKLIFILFNQIIKVNLITYFLLIYKICGCINIIIKLLLISNYYFMEFTFMLDLGDLVLKMVEDTSNNIKGTESNIDTSALPIVESKNESNIVNEDAMEFEEWIDYIKVHRPKLYWGLVVAFSVTTIFCIWLMNKIIGPAFPPREPPMGL